MLILNCNNLRISLRRWGSWKPWISLGRGIGCALILIAIFPEMNWATVLPSCSKLGAPHHEWHDSRDRWNKSIFVGKALGHIKGEGYQFEVQRSWTENTPEKIFVWQNSNYRFGAKFEPGRLYLIYGEYIDESYKVIRLDPCAREKPVEKVSLELEFLDAAPVKGKVDVLIKKLPVIIQTHSDSGMREEAVKIFRKLDKEEYPREQRVDVFLKALKDPYPGVRAAAAESFNPENEISHYPGVPYQDIAGDKIIDGLIPLLQDQDLSARIQSASALKYVGMDSDRGVPALIVAYEKEIAEPAGGELGSPVPSAYLIEAYFTALAEGRSKKARKYMLPLFKESLLIRKGRRKALYFLLRWGVDARALEPELLGLFVGQTKPLDLKKNMSISEISDLQRFRMMSSNDMNNVLRILGNMRSKRVVPLIIKFVDRRRNLFDDKGSCGFLLLAIRALDQAGTPQAIKELEDRLLPGFLKAEKKKDPPCRMYVLESFGNLTSEISKKAISDLREIRKKREQE